MHADERTSLCHVNSGCCIQAAKVPHSLYVDIEILNI